MYKYTKNNLLNYKENYMYSDFEGKNFINDFIISRKSFQNKLKELIWSSNHKIRPLDIGIKFILFNLKNDQEKIKYSQFRESILKDFNKDQPKFNSIIYKENFDTSEFFTSLIYELILYDNNIQLLKNEIGKIIQRFEVSKRIHNKYEKKFSNGYGSSKNIKLYIILSCLLNLYYLRTSSLPSLNCNLKIMDLIISQPLIKDIKNNFYAPLHSLVEIEKIYISNLIQKTVDEK